MRVSQKLFLQSLIVVALSSCAGISHQYYDSAINDHNRVPASFDLPNSFDEAHQKSASVHDQANADFLFLKSELESNAGNGSESIDLLKDILAYDPTAVTVIQRLSIEYYKRGKLQEALYWAEKARSIAPERRDVGLLVAGLYTTTKKYSKAESVYKSLIKKDADDLEATLYLGAVYTEQKNYDKAAQIFKKLSAAPGYGSQYLAYYYLARVHSEQKPVQYSSVKTNLQKCIDLKPDFFEAIGMMGQLIEKNEGKEKAIQFYVNYQAKKGPNLKIAEVLAQYFIAKGDYDKAYEQLEILDDSDDELVQVKLKMALILIEKKIYNKAIAKLEEILVLVPDSDKVRFYLSAVYEEKREFKKAFEEYQKVQKHSDYYEESRLHAAHLARVLNKVDDAETLLKEAIGEKTENPQLYFLLSQVYEDKKEVDKALEVLVKAEKTFSKNEHVLFQLGVFQDRVGKKDDMMATMKKVVEINSNHAQALNYLSYTWAERSEQLELAEVYARKAVKKEPADAYIMDTLGWVLFKKGKLKESIAVLEKAHALLPDAGIISEHLGDVYSQMNLNDKAKQFFFKAYESEEDDKRKEEIKTKLTQVEDKIKSARMPASAASDSKQNESP